MPALLLEQVLENPFLVLGLQPACSRRDVEREGQKLLGMLELGLSEASTYATPAGRRPRTPEMVRSAMAELRDPARRLSHEVLALGIQASSDALPDGTPAAWEDSFAALGFGKWLFR